MLWRTSMVESNERPVIKMRPIIKLTRVNPTLTVQLPQELMTELRTHANDVALSVSFIVRFAIEDYLKANSPTTWRKQ